MCNVALQRTKASFAFFFIVIILAIVDDIMGVKESVTASKFW